MLEEYFVKTANQRTIERKKTNDFIKTRRELCSEKYEKESSNLVVDLGIEQDRIIFMSRYAPMVIANLTVSEIRELDGDNRIQSVSYYQEPEESTCTVDSVYETSNISFTNGVFGLTGEGVKIGVFEMGGFPDSSCDELKNASITNVGSGYVYGHVTNTVSILVGDTSGIVKDAEVYCSNSDFENVEALLDYGVQIINVSFAWLYDETNTGTSYAYSTKDKWVDHLVSYHAVTVVASAGNNGDGTDIQRVASPAMGHNVIAVGAYNDMNTPLDYTDDKMYSYSSYKNTNGTDETTGIEKPDVVLPGNILSGGTSSSAPVLTGMIALMFELKPSLAVHPQAVKAIVLASCHRKVLPALDETRETMVDGLTERQGAGVPDVWTMASIICQGTYGIGTINSNRTTAFRRFVLPSYDATQMNVSIAWLRENTRVDEDSLTNNNITVGEYADLDLAVKQNGTVVKTSYNDSSSTEMTYVNLDSTKVNYLMQVNKMTNNTGTVRYGYAYSTNMAYAAPVTEEGVYYIRNFYHDTYLTLNSSTSEVDLEAFDEDDSQKWILRKYGETYELIPASGNSNEKLNVGDQVGTNPYYRTIVGDNCLNLAVNKWETDSTMYADAVTFTYEKEGTYNILTMYNSTTGVFASSDTISTVNMYRSWVLEKINYRRGDVNADGSLDSKDWTSLQNYLNGTEQLDNLNMFLADANYDGEVNGEDVLKIKKLIMGIDMY